LKRRSRIVSFRLSDEEYDSLRTVSSTRGARSVSEFTRSVACGVGEDRKIEETLRLLNEHMQLIEVRLKTITETLQNATNGTKEEQGE
jgi:hypothetical protein